MRISGMVMIAAVTWTSSPEVATAQRIVAAPGETLLEVSAQGEVAAAPDMAELSVGITSKGASARVAIAAADAVAAGLIAAARGAGVPDGSLRTQSVNVRATHAQSINGDQTDAVTGYQASYRLTVRLSDIGRTPAVVDALIEAGATDLDGPRFGFADDAGLRRQARAKAVAAATAEANDYAAALHMRVVRIIRVSERGIASDGGSDIVVTGVRMLHSPILPGTQATSSTVWIDYPLAPAEPPPPTPQS